MAVDTSFASERIADLPKRSMAAVNLACNHTQSVCLPNETNKMPYIKDEVTLSQHEALPFDRSGTKYLLQRIYK